MLGHEIMVDPLSIVTWKWDNGIHIKKNLKFTSQHVNIMKNMLTRNLTIPFKFFCVTDDPQGLDDDIHVIPLWNDYRNLGGCFTRLKCFQKEMRFLFGERFASIDIDAVIVGNVDHIFSRTEDFLIAGGEDRRTKFCGCFFIMASGCRSEVWETFSPDLVRTYPTKFIQGKKFYIRGTDQFHITNVLGRRDETILGNKEGLYMFGQDIFVERKKVVDRNMVAEATKHLVVRQNGIIRRMRNSSKRQSLKNQLEEIKEEIARITAEIESNSELEKNKRWSSEKLPSDASIVFFNGKYDPSQKRLQNAFPWIRENWY